MQGPSSSSRLWTCIVLLAGTAVLLHLRGDVDRVPPSQPLSELPIVIGPWIGEEIPLKADILEILGKGSFLNRVYSPKRTNAGVGQAALDTPLVGLFIGYFPTQRTGQAIHSPQNCLPGSGWVFETKGRTDLVDGTGKHYQVGEYLISNGTSRQEVLYWYRSHGRSMANDYVAKLYTLLDSIRYNRTDAALVRVVTPLQKGESLQEAHLRAVSFAEQLTPSLPAFIPD